MKTNQNQYKEKLWQLIDSISRGLSRQKILETLYHSSTVRSLQKDIKRLKTLGLQIKLSTKTDLYSLQFPETKLKLELSPKEFFHLFLSIKESALENHFDLPSANKIQQALYNERDHIIDLSSSFLANGEISEIIQAVFHELRAAIRHRQTVLFNYSNRQGQIQRVQPHYLVQTLHSFYLIGYELHKKEFLTYKLIRISNLTIDTDSPFKRKELDFHDYRGDAFYLRTKKDSPAQNIQILFQGSAAQSICEYKMHPSQKFIDQPQGTLVTWQLSDLTEITSWLMQWLGTFTIISPQTLKNEINKRLSQHQENNLEAPSPRCSKPGNAPIHQKFNTL